MNEDPQTTRVHATPGELVPPQFRWEVARYLNTIFRFRDKQLMNWAFGVPTAGTWTERTLFGRRMALDISRSDAQRLLYIMGERMIEERCLIEKFVQPGMRAVDIGANLGYHLLLLHHLVGPQGHVTCVEPSPENLPELRANIAVNQFRNVTLHEVAVGDTDETLGVRTGVNGGMVPAEQSAACVRVVPLDRLLEGRVDFIKIDVDGFEGKVLQGSRQVLERDHPVVLLEMHPHILPKYGSSCQQIYQLLREYYTNITAYETARPNTLSLLAKVAARYSRNGGLRQITDVPELIAQSDAGKHPYTYWLICQN